jgi:hypothetical protein
MISTIAFTLRFLGEEAKASGKAQQYQKNCEYDLLLQTKRAV